MPNSQIMFIGTCKTYLYIKKKSLSAFNTASLPELLADVGHGGPQEDGHHLLYLDHQ